MWRGKKIRRRSNDIEIQSIQTQSVQTQSIQTQHRVLPRALGGGSCFSEVIPTLQAEGHQVTAAQYGLNTTADDVATVISTLGRVSSPPSSSGILTAEPSSPALEPTTALRGWSMSPRSLRMPTRHLRHSSPSSRRRTSFPTSRSPTDVSGCVRKAPSVSQVICPSRKRSHRYLAGI